jgi:hypothetical protein
MGAVTSGRLTTKNETKKKKRKKARTKTKNKKKTKTRKNKNFHSRLRAVVAYPPSSLRINYPPPLVALLCLRVCARICVFGNASTHVKYPFLRGQFALLSFEEGGFWTI